jgi:hypothetical protein
MDFILLYEIEQRNHLQLLQVGKESAEGER